MTPFVAPETLERQLGVTFRLRRGANESAFGPSPFALRAAATCLVSHYGDPQSTKLKRALAEKHGVSVDEVAVAGGIDELLSLFCRLLLNSGDAIATSLGSYATLEHGALAAGATVMRVPYRNDAPDLEALAMQNVKLVYLANPDNPSGLLHSAEAVAKFRDSFSTEIGLLLDEAYADFVPEDWLPKSPPNTIRFRTFSKAHGMAGLRIGYALADAALVAALDKIRLHFAVNGPAQAAALASLKDSEHLAQVVQATLQGRKRLEEIGGRLNLRPLPSETNFVLLDARSAERANLLLTELLSRGVFVRKPNQPPLDRCIRITVGPPAEDELLEFILKEAITTVDAQLAQGR